MVYEITPTQLGRISSPTKSPKQPNGGPFFQDAQGVLCQSPDFTNHHFFWFTSKLVGTQLPPFAHHVSRPLINAHHNMHSHHFESPYERDCYSGITRFESQTTRPQTTNLPLLVLSFANLNQNKHFVSLQSAPKNQL